MHKLFERIGAWLTAAADWIVAEPVKPARPAPEPEPEQPPAAEHLAGPWHTLSGGVIELGSTGFLIRHRPGVTVAEFVLESPEGRTMFTAGPGFLLPLKQAAERCAAERAEFAEHVGTGGTGDAVATMMVRFRSLS